jgi:uncharacterized protein involved in exopolysaccharide biosynthesis
LLIAALGAGAGFLWLVRQPRIYEASASVIIEPMAPTVLNNVKDVVELGAGSYWANRDFYETQYQIIQSRGVVERAISTVGLAAMPDYPAPGSPRPTDLVKYVQGSLRVAPTRDSRIANIIVQDRRADRAAQLANALAQSFIESNLDHKLEGAKDATLMLGDQVVDLQERLKRAERRLYEYRKQNRLLDVGLDARLNMNAENVRAYSQRLAEIRTRKAELESSRRVALAAKGDLEEQESLPDIRDNEVIKQIRIAYLDLARALAELETKYGEKHPAIEAVKRKIQRCLAS